MNRFVVFALLLASCSTIPVSIPQRHVYNGCTIDAVNFQASLKENEVEWSKLLTVFYGTKEDYVGHSMCVFRDKRGRVYAWDRSGYIKLKCSGLDPSEVGKEIFSDFICAKYD